MNKIFSLDNIRTEIAAIVKRCSRRIAHVLTQPGHHDLTLSMAITATVLAPLWAHPVAAQVGVDEAGQVLCSEGNGLNIAQIITIGLGLLSAYFILKFLVRMMAGLDKAGSTESDRAQSGKDQARGGIYSLVAALLPLIVPAFLQAASIDVVTCLLP